MVEGSPPGLVSESLYKTLPAPRDEVMPAVAWTRAWAANVACSCAWAVAVRSVATWVVASDCSLCFDLPPAVGGVCHANPSDITTIKASRQDRAANIGRSRCRLL